MHITSSVFINDGESGLHHDYDAWLEKIAPHEPTSQYRHNDTGEDNADAHMKRQVMGREVVVAVTVKVVFKSAFAGAPVKVTVGTASAAVVAWVAVAVK